MEGGVGARRKEYVRWRDGRCMEKECEYEKRKEWV